MSHKLLLWFHLRLETHLNKIKCWSTAGQGGVKAIVLLMALWLSSCSHVFYQPIKGALVEPARFKAHAQEVWLKASDGTKLHAWAFRAEKPKGTILQFHGNAENMSTHFLNLLWLVGAGYDLLVFDYRGYGFSEGEPTQAGVHLDALAAMEWAYRDHVERKTRLYVVFGQSLGGHIAARAMVDFPQQDKVSLLVQDSTFANYKGIAANKLGSRWFLWPFYPLAYVAVSNEYAADRVLGRIKAPVLGIHSVDDPVVPYKLGRDANDLIKSKKWWWKVKVAGHTECFHYPKTPYRKKFLEFLDRL